MQVYVKLGTLADFFLTYVTHWLGGTFSKFMKKSSLVCWFLRGKHWFSFGLFHLVYFHRLVMTFRKNINAYFNKVESFALKKSVLCFSTQLLMSRRHYSSGAHVIGVRTPGKIVVALCPDRCSSSHVYHPHRSFFLPLVSQHMLWIYNYHFRST